MSEFGYADTPATRDKLGLDGYVEGLANYMESCATPMTMSIQGDWGSGKTSLFNLIESRLDPKNNSNVIGIVKINTWQFSVAGYQDGLVQFLISEILDELAPDDAFNNTKDAIVKALSFVRRFTWAYLTNTNDENGSNNEDFSIQRIASEIKELKDKLEKLVKESRAGKGADARLIVFIDDLDRLEPECAVGLMEGIKNFLDCEGCVFVLAIDEKVVFEGIKKKYGEDIGDERKQMFFDKLIQVPFSIPKTAYDIDCYIEFLLEDEGSGNAKKCAEVLQAVCCDLNPRSIKRILNRAKLQEAISSTTALNNKHEVSPMLLAAIAVLLEDPVAFSILSQSDLNDDDKLTEELANCRIDWQKVASIFDDEGSQKSLVENRKDFKSWIVEIGKTQDLPMNALIAQILRMAVEEYELVETKGVGQRTILNDRRDNRVLMINDRGGDFTLTIYQKPLPESKPLGALVEQFKKDKVGWKWQAGNLSATYVLKPDQSPGVIIKQLKSYFDCINGQG